MASHNEGLDEDKRIMVGTEDFQPQLISTTRIRGRAYYEGEKKKLLSLLPDFSMNLPSFYDKDKDLPEKIHDSTYYETEKIRRNKELNEIVFGMFPFLDEPSEAHVDTPKEDKVEMNPDLSLSDEIKEIMHDFQTEQNGRPSIAVPKSTRPALDESPGLSDRRQGIQRLLASTPRETSNGAAISQDNFPALGISPIGSSSQSADVLTSSPCFRHLSRESVSGEMTKNASPARILVTNPKNSVQNSEGKPETCGQPGAGNQTISNEKKSHLFGSPPCKGAFVSHLKYNTIDCWHFPGGPVVKDEMDAANIRTLTAVTLAGFVLKYRELIAFPATNTLPGSWIKIVRYCIQLGNNVYADLSPQNRRFLTEEESVRLLRTQAGIHVKLDKPHTVRIKDTDDEKTLSGNLDSLYYGYNTSSALYMFEHSPFIFISFKGEGIVFLHTQSSCFDFETLIVRCPGTRSSQMEEFLSCIKNLTLLNDCTFGNFTRVRLA